MARMPLPSQLEEAFRSPRSMSSCLSERGVRAAAPRRFPEVAHHKDCQIFPQHSRIAQAAESKRETGVSTARLLAQGAHLTRTRS